MLMQQLQQERLTIADSSISSCRRSLEDTHRRTSSSARPSGQPIATFQNTQFKLAELATEVEVGQAFVDKLLVAHTYAATTSSPRSAWPSGGSRTSRSGSPSECLQLHGGYGFMSEYPISGDYADAAVQSIYAGTNEIMKVIIARRLGL